MARVILRGLTIWLALACAPIARAEVLVLVHGYFGDAGDWRGRGVTAVLERHGYHDGGLLSAGPRAMPFPAGTIVQRTYYTLDLPGEAPLLAQQRLMEPLLGWIFARHEGESIWLVGYSAGGVLGRLYLVGHPDAPVAGLVTISSPHLGTELAGLGVLAGNSPLAMIPGIGSLLRGSQALYQDLAPEQSGNLLFWLNRQPHPPVQYLSIVKFGDGVTVSNGDSVVPEWSQDLNAVQALRGRARSVRRPGFHPLDADDGEWIVRLIGDAGRT